MYRISRFSFCVICVGALVAFTASSLPAQNINTATPFTSVNDSFYENFGVSFGFSIPGGRGNGSRIVGLGPQGQLLPNIVFQNGLGGVSPPFGGYTPGSGATFGFGNFGPRGGGYSLGFNLAQGSTRTSTTVVPSLTTQNGFGGSMFSGQVRPFVTGVVPVVGGRAVPAFGGGMPGFGYGSSVDRGRAVYFPDNGVTRALQSGQLDLSRPATPEPRVSETPVIFSNENSTATRGDLSVSQIKAERQRRLAAKQQKLESHLTAAQEFESAGKYAEARAEYQEAAQQTDDATLKARIKRRIKATRSK